MPNSVTSAFSEPEDFKVALRKEGCLGLLVTDRDQFRARLTQITLQRLRLSGGDEKRSRIAFVAVPCDLVLISFPVGTAASPIWGGTGVRAGEIMIVGPGQRLHARTNGSCRWGAIWLPVDDLIRYGAALTGAPFDMPSVARSRRPAPAARRYLGQLHAAAMRIGQTRPQLLVDPGASHGLEQQLIHALVECLSKGTAIEVAPATCEHRDVALRLEALLQTQPEHYLRTVEISAALGVSARALRISCEEQLGMGPTEYVRRRHMQPVPARDRLV